MKHPGMWAAAWLAAASVLFVFGLRPSESGPRLPSVGSLVARVGRLVARPSSAPREAVALEAAQTLVARDASEAVFRVQVRAPDAPAGRSHLAVALVLDVSGSMTGNKLDNARRAARSFVDRLRDDDTVAVVAFSDAATTVAPVGPVGGRREEIQRAIDELQSSGGTCIGCGLDAAYLSLAETRGLRRVVILSDGVSGEGAVLEDRATSAQERLGITTSSLGLGADYDAPAMSSIARGGAGRHYFVHNSRLISEVLEREIDSLRAAAFDRASVVLSATPGATLVPPDGVHARAEGEALSIALGPLRSGETRSVLVTVRLAPGADTTLAARAAFGSSREERAASTVARSDDEAAIRGSRHAAVAAEVERLRSAAVVQEALRTHAAGDAAGGREALAREAARLRAAAAELDSGALRAEATSVEAMRAELGRFAPGSREGRGLVLLGSARERELSGGRTDGLHGGAIANMTECE